MIHTSLPSTLSPEEYICSTHAEKEYQRAKNQIFDLKELVLKANQSAASCEAKYQISVEEAINLKNLLKADKEVLVQSWVQGNITLKRLQFALDEEKTRSQQERERTRILMLDEKRHKEEKKRLQQELELERNRLTSLQLIFAQNITSALANMSSVLTAYSNSQALLKKSEDEKRRYEELNSVMSQKVTHILQILYKTTNETRQMSEHVKQTLLSDLESVRRLSASLKSNFSTNILSQIQSLESRKCVVRVRENLKKLAHILNGRTKDEALTEAAQSGNVTELEILLDAGANIEIEDATNKMTPLISAAKSGHLDACRYLVERGANISARTTDWRGRTVLHVTTDSNNSDVVKFLVEKGADVNAMDKSNCTPLHHAVVNNALDVIRFLVAKGADVNTKGYNGNTPLHYATKNNRLDVIKFLVKNGADVNAENHCLDIPLHFAAKNMRVDAIKFLFERGADVNARNFIEDTPLHYATESNNTIDVIEFLVEKGADVNSVNDLVDFTPLHYAAQNNRLDVIKFLSERGANVNAKNTNNKTAADLGNETTKAWFRNRLG